VDKQLLTMPEAQGVLNIGKGTLRAMLDSGELPRVVIGKRGVRIPTGAVIAWIKRQTEEKERPTLTTSAEELRDDAASSNRF
jgi:excisionase family DNA binding protein